jgi:hypothetical protein
MNKSDRLFFIAYLTACRLPATMKIYHRHCYINQIDLFQTKKSQIVPVILQDFSSLDNSDNYDNECNDKQRMNEPTCMKCKETNQPTDDEDNCNDVQ